MTSHLVRLEADTFGRLGSTQHTLEMPSVTGTLQQTPPRHGNKGRHVAAEPMHASQQRSLGSSVNLGESHATKPPSTNTTEGTAPKKIGGGKCIHSSRNQNNGSAAIFPVHTKLGSVQNQLHVHRITSIPGVDPPALWKAPCNSSQSRPLIGRKTGIPDNNAGPPDFVQFPPSFDPWTAVRTST